MSIACHLSKRDHLRINEVTNYVVLPLAPKSVPAEQLHANERPSPTAKLKCIAFSRISQRHGVKYSTYRVESMKVWNGSS